MGIVVTWACSLISPAQISMEERFYFNPALTK